jgi:hypothetical protein
MTVEDIQSICRQLTGDEDIKWEHDLRSLLAGNVLCGGSDQSPTTAIYGEG